MNRRLLASIHDVGPRFEAQIDVLSDRLTQLLERPRFAMLVVPDHWDEAPLARSPAFAAKLRAWADGGVEMFLHGWRHRDTPEIAGTRVQGFARRHMTAGEGEFAALSRADATVKIIEGRKVVEDAIGRPISGFVAPAWLYSTGALQAVADAGFVIAEDHMKVWNPANHRVLARGPVITWASRSPARIRSSLAFSRLARATLPILPTVRIAVHPGDVAVPALLHSIDATFERFVRTHRPSRYADLLA